MAQNIVDRMCEKRGLKGKGKYTELGKLFGLPRQHINGWKMRNKIPEAHYRRARELTGMEYEEFFPNSQRSTRVPMTDFLTDVTRYIELARAGTTVELTVGGNAVVKVSSAQARA